MKPGEAVTVVLVTMFGFYVAANNGTTPTVPLTTEATTAVKTTAGPMHPTTGPMHPTTGPMPPTTGPKGPTTGPMAPTTGPKHPTTGPMHPTTGPMPPTTGPMHPTTGPMHPTTLPMRPTTGPMHPTTGPTLFTNATAAPSVTSPNMTTTPTATARATTTPQSTIPPEQNTWEVPNGKNGSCQSMHFYANITVPYYNTSDLLDSVMVSVPSWSNASGTCLKEKREFILDFIPDGGDRTWNLRFVFTADSTAYELTSLNVQFNYDDVLFNTKKQGQQSSSFVSMDSPLAGLNASLDCPCKRDALQIQSKDKEQLRVAFTDLNIQPFYLKEGTCKPSPPQPPGPSQPANRWMSVGIAFIVMFVVLLLISVSYVVYVKKYNKQPSDNLRLMENY